MFAFLPKNIYPCGVKSLKKEQNGVNIQTYDKLQFYR